ncbi:hypothetical protein BLOT_005861 [Blomia tropicalis]|nr:hypothetical protein BLOT_005861 [Blomia tropicalis]
MANYGAPSSTNSTKRTFMHILTLHLSCADSATMNELIRIFFSIYLNGQFYTLWDTSLQTSGISQ